MLNKFVLFATLFLCISSKLYQVVSLTRHGARYHVNVFGDGNDTKPFWGQLTSVGMRQHQNLGKIFRQQYINKLKFLSPTYKSSEIEVYSTPYNRTVTSILSQLYGLYPLKTGPRLTSVDRIWHIPPYSNKTDDQQQNYALPSGHQPIAIKLNNLIMLSDDCPNFGINSKRNMQIKSDMVNQMNVTYYPFFKKLSPMYNFTLSTATFYTMLRVWDCVNVDNYLGRPLPKNFTQQDEKNVLHLANWYYDITTANNNSIMFASGKLQKVVSVFDMRVRLPTTYDLKWSFLSGHDNDIFALYNALNLSTPQCIEEVYRKGTTSALNCEAGANLFTASLIFQLHSDDQKTFYVKIKSNGKYVNLCGKKSTQCEYNQFKTIAKKSITSNIDQICGKKINQSEKILIEDIYRKKTPYILEQ